MFRSIIKTIDKSRNFVFYLPCRTVKSEMPLNWTRPQKIPNYKPEKSGDLKPLEDIDMTQFPAIYEKSTELQTANDVVKRIFSLEFQDNDTRIKAMRSHYMEKVRRHDMDFTSQEAIIAGMTATIRHVQIYMDKFTVKRAPRHMRVFIKELVEKREKRLAILRLMDYRRFEWLLDKLDLVYKPRPEVCEKVYRKNSLRKLADKYCDTVRKNKFNQLREHFESQQEEFLTKKLETYKWIQEKEKAMGVDLSVTDEEIEDICKRLEAVKARKKEAEVD